MIELTIQPFEPKELSVKLEINHLAFANFMNKDIVNKIHEIKAFA